MFGLGHRTARDGVRRDAGEVEMMTSRRAIAVAMQPDGNGGAVLPLQMAGLGVMARVRPRRAVPLSLRTGTDDA